MDFKPEEDRERHGLGATFEATRKNDRGAKFADRAPNTAPFYLKLNEMPAEE
jgi:hypothetical protein